MEKELALFTDKIFSNIKLIVLQAKQKVAYTSNSELTLMYWHIGKHIANNILNEARAEYGKQIIIQLSGKMTSEFGKGWSDKQLRHCLRIAETFSEEEIVSAVRRQLSWTHVKTLANLLN